MFKKFWISLVIASTLLMSVPSVSASTSILPGMGEDDEWCDPNDEDLKQYFMEGVNSGSDDLQAYIEEKGVDGASGFLACAMKLGYVKFWMIPYFVLYALQFVIQLAGLIAVLMVVVGGYYYIAGGITDDKEKGKHIITYALGGFVMVITSWFVVNLILLALTS
jgi:uncharacterized membrane protein YvlD (DUF360 family)